MSRYVLGPDADRDLEEIWEYIARDDIDAADHWVAKLFHAFESLAQTPGMGHTRTDLTSHKVLFWPVGVYLIIYRVRASSPIEIVAITQGSRDVPTFLQQRMR